MKDDQPSKGVSEDALIQRLLHTFLNMLDKQQTRLRVKVNKKTTPELYQFNDQDTEYLWSLITDELATRFHILRIELNKKGNQDPVYDQATLRFCREQEGRVRRWLKRPKETRYTQQWQEALNSTAYFTKEQQGLLAKAPMAVPTMSAQAVIVALHQVQSELQLSTTAMSLRTLSSRCFLGNSKVLEHKGEWLADVFPEQKDRIKPRPLLLTAVIPEHVKYVLFIENQQTLLQLYHAQHTDLSYTALIYSAGFLSSASRSRQVGCAVFATLNSPSDNARSYFEQWWTSEDSTLPCYFWGDLDFEGMRILAALKQSFTQLQAWQIGYEAMLSFYRNGICHKPEQANKQDQQDPGSTHCHYADTVLLPLMRSEQRFLDQEVVDLMTR